MVLEAHYIEMKEKLQLSKKLYQTRHYAQCAKLGERLLREINDEIHPIHLAHLHFYTALSHDTLAREATLKFRHVELNLAEEHYSAAIEALTSAKIALPRSVQRAPSAASTSSNEEFVWHRRRGSGDSTHSSASSATSYEHDDNISPKSKPSGPGRLQAKIQRESGSAIPKMPLIPKSSVTPLQTRPQTPLEHELTPESTDFVRMIEHHIQSVRDLKEKSGAAPKRYSMTTRPVSFSASKFRASQAFDDKDGDIVRENRRKMKFRPRFDPTSIQALCNEALEELK